MSASTELFGQVKNLLLEDQKRSVDCAGERLALLSHELRTPLGAIIGFAELMHDDKLGAISARHKEYLGVILESSLELERIIDQLHEGVLRVDVQQEGIDVLAAEIERIFVEFRRKNADEIQRNGSTLHTELQP